MLKGSVLQQPSTLMFSSLKTSLTIYNLLCDVLLNFGDPCIDPFNLLISVVCLENFSPAVFPLIKIKESRKKKGLLIEPNFARDL